MDMKDLIEKELECLLLREILPLEPESYVVVSRWVNKRDFQNNCIFKKPLTNPMQKIIKERELSWA